MSVIQCRQACKSDIPAIVGLLADDPLGQSREKPSDPQDRRYCAAFEAIETDPNQFLMVAVDGDAVIGCLQITFIPGLTYTGMLRGQIEGVRIASDRRGSGLGKEMLNWAIEQCRARGCGIVQLTADKTREDAHRFYKQLGFEAKHDGFKLML